MRIYLAGKVKKNCWRHGAVQGIYGALEDLTTTCPSGLNDSDLTQVSHALNFPVLPRSIFGRHDYVGPYFLQCDHGCWHGDSSHGLDQLHRETVRSACLTAINKAELVFAWIDTRDCFGTIAELGYARASMKKIAIAGPEKFDDLWFSYSLANLLVFDHQDPIEALRFALDRMDR